MAPKSKAKPAAAKPAGKPAAKARASKSKVRASGARNSEIAPGIFKYSRSASYAKKGKWAKELAKAKKTKAGSKAAAVVKPVVKKITGSKNGETRTVLPKEPKFYPADDVKKPLKNRRHSHPAKLRSSLTPGSVVILLSGRFRGKRCVFLKQLKSGLLLVTGPYKINGVPLRRVNATYVIATSTSIDVSKVNTDKFTDEYFKRPATATAKKGEEDFFAQEAEKTEIAPERIEDQKAMDAQVLPLVKKVPMLKDYLNAHFTLSSGQFPHEMVF